MKKFTAFLLFSALIACGCSDTFVVTKDGKGYFFGSNRKEFRQMLCDSGDLGTILADAQLPQNTRDNLYNYNCIAAQQSKEKVKETYSGMSPAQRRNLRLAFQKHGYDINYMEC